MPLSSLVNVTEKGIANASDVPQEILLFESTKSNDAGRRISLRSRTRAMCKASLPELRIERSPTGTARNLMRPRTARIPVIGIIRPFG